MKINLKYLLIIAVFLIMSISAVSAADLNQDISDISQNADDLNHESSLKAVYEDGLDKNDIGNDDVNNNQNNENDNTNDSNNNTSPEPVIKKTNPKITLKTTRLYSKDTLTVYLKNSTNSPLKSKKLTVTINNKKFNIYTDSKGIANLKLSSPSKSLKANVSFLGDDYNKALNRTFTLRFSKLSSNIKRYSNFVVKNNYLYFYLTDKFGNPTAGKKITVKYKYKTYKRKTNSYGRIGFKIRSYPGYTYSISLKFNGDKYYKGTSKKFGFHVTNSLNIVLSNRKLLTKGNLRIYLKGNERSLYSNKKLIIKIGGKRKFVKNTNGEGIVNFKPNMTAKKYYVVVWYGKYYVSKIINCIEGNVKDPFKNNISMVSGAPNIDYMPGQFVMGDGSRTYSVMRSQYREVLIRDSYCLFLNNYLSKYVCFKTKSHPNTYHIIKREKWNVIERAINTMLVHKNKKDYWPGTVTVSLKGKSYTYSEVRDAQNTGYTCGPTASSVCTQVLRSYFCESYLARLSHTNRSGSTAQNMKNALEKLNFSCSFFYKNSFNTALAELKKSGCAVVFHTKNHYVTILDISKDGKKVLVSNSYGSYYNIPTKWLSVSYMKTRFWKWDDGLIIRLNYTLSESKKNSVNCFYNSMGTKWIRKNTRQSIGMS